MFDHAKFCGALTHAPYSLGDPKRQARAILILMAAEALKSAMDLRQLAYCFSTALWETAFSLSPIAEIGHGQGRAYGRPDWLTGQTYYGRGFVQTTWKANYQKVEALLDGIGLHVDLVHHPDLLLDAKYAAPALFVALEQGIYTGKKLSDYFNAKKQDPLNARRTVNGTDHATTIAGFYPHFLSALQLAHIPDGPPAAAPKPVPALA